MRMVPRRLPGATAAPASTSWRTVTVPRRMSSGPSRWSALEDEAKTIWPFLTVTFTRTPARVRTTLPVQACVCSS